MLNARTSYLYTKLAYESVALNAIQVALVESIIEFEKGIVYCAVESVY